MMRITPRRWSSVEEYAASHSIVRKVVVASSDNKTLSADKSSLRDLLGGLLFYVGIPATTLYSLGFFDEPPIIAGPRFPLHLGV
jgi:hypothetical protein